MRLSELRTGRLVLEANQALLWGVLAATGTGWDITGHGRLLRAGTSTTGSRRPDRPAIRGRPASRSRCRTARISRQRPWSRSPLKCRQPPGSGSAPGRQYAELVARTVRVHPPRQRTPVVVERPTAALPDPGRDLVLVVAGLEADVEV